VRKHGGNAFERGLGLIATQQGLSTVKDGFEPFEEGCDAYGRGLARDECPYEERSDEHESWRDGWDEAKHYGEDEEVIDNV
jgi:ribosome modulation factor